MVSKLTGTSCYTKKLSHLSPNVLMIFMKCKTRQTHSILNPVKRCAVWGEKLKRNKTNPEGIKGTKQLERERESERKIERESRIGNSHSVRERDVRRCFE